VERCAEILWTDRGAQVREWLTEERGIPGEVLAANRVGCDPGPRWLARPKGLPWKGVGAVFPAFDPAGQVTYFQVRYLGERPGRDRYENPAMSMAANPRLSWTVTPNVVEPGVLVVAEGLPDAYTAAAAGLPTVGLLGAAAPDARVADLLNRHRSGRTLVLACDAGNLPGTGNELLRDLLAERQAPVSTVEISPAFGDLNAWAVRDPGWAGQLLATQRRAQQAPTVPDVPTVAMP
jgi:hypothetical protein